MTAPEHTQLAAELAREWGSRLSAAVEMMAQQPLTVSAAEPGSEEITRAASLPSLAYALSNAPDSPFRVSTPDESSAGIAKAALTASGIEDFDDALLKETWQEILTQAASGLAQYAGTRIGTPVSCAAAKEAAGSLENALLVGLNLGGTDFPSLFIGFPNALLDSLAAPPDEEAEDDQTSLVHSHVASNGPLPATLDLLLDVEMPVSVSFGRTFLAVREVLKLATGSIIELDRPVNQFVEVVVNNCVIARGEVVVIEGNYGVRIHEIISRTDRMALQHLTGMNSHQPTRMSA